MELFIAYAGQPQNMSHEPDSDVAVTRQRIRDTGNLLTRDGELFARNQAADSCRSARRSDRTSMPVHQNHAATLRSKSVGDPAIAVFPKRTLTLSSRLSAAQRRQIAPSILTRLACDPLWITSGVCQPPSLCDPTIYVFDAHSRGSRGRFHGHR